MKTKRFFDIVFSAAAIIVLLPFMGIVCAVIYLDDGCPVIFKQDRVGKDGKIFKVKKFRTMINGTRNTATIDLKEANDVITRSGRFIRKTSIDELPQLFNILEGTMSFVGPRPLIPQEKGIHELRLACGVYRVCPGMTGLAQISGRDMISHEEKVRFDKEYVDNISVLNDIKIVAKTVKTVIKGENVVEGGQANNEKLS
jgi:O-antigen biosynthesis protein WbqP